MQTLDAVQKGNKEILKPEADKTTFIARLFLVAFCLCVGLFLGTAIVAATSSQAYAKSFSVPKVDINANAATDGSLNIVENRTFDFDGSFSLVYWELGYLPSNGQLQVNGVGITRIDSSGNAIGATQQLEQVSFVLSWREAGGPSTEAYSIDAASNGIYAFFNSADERVIVTIDYTIVNGVQAYKDVGEIYWKYVGEGWDVPSENVTMVLTLPVPQGTTVIPGDNIRAWGHGPLDGTVTINEDGSVTYVVPRVNVGQFAEARVVFPTEWLTNLSGEDSLIHITETRLEDVLRDEQIWADQANKERVLSLVLIIGFALLAIAVLLWAILTFRKYGKEHTSQFTEKYWRDVPSPQDHPAVIARLWRWNKEKSDDFTATLMYLSHKGAIQINKGSYEKPGTFRSKTVDDYYMTRVPAVADTLTNPIDIKTLDVLFNKIGGGQDSVWFGAIQKYGKDKPKEFVDAMSTWQGVLTAETNKRDFFEIKGQALQMVMAFVAVLLVVASFAVWLFLANFFPLIFCIPVAIVLFAIANYMPRRSQEGNTLYAKSWALQNWLKDFSQLNERPPLDVKVWGEFMVYAYIFGIAKKVMQELQITLPELFEESGTAMGVGYVPWWIWYSGSYGAHGAMMSPAGDILQSSVTNTIRTAQAAMSGGSGGFSSGGGFGGGFSGGGGGGFGGGGGGAR